MNASSQVLTYQARVPVPPIQAMPYDQFMEHQRNLGHAFPENEGGVGDGGPPPSGWHNRPRGYSNERGRGNGRGNFQNGYGRRGNYSERHNMYSNNAELHEGPPVRAGE